MKSQERLSLLEQMDFITKAEATAIQAFLKQLNADLRIDFQTDGAWSMLVTHLAAFLRRAKNEEVIQPLFPEQMADLALNPNYHIAQNSLALLKQHFSIPTYEEGYFLLHLCNIQKDKALFHAYILPHEHMSIDLSGPKQDNDSELDVYLTDKNELATLKKQGVIAVFDCSAIGMGRNYQTNALIEQEFGIKVIKGTGYYKDPFLPAYVETATVEELADIMIKELTEPDLTKKAHFIGEIGTSLNNWTTNEMKVFEAAVLAHQATQAPILTHTTLGTLGIDQVKFFKARNVNPKRIIISHVDLKKDFESIVELLKEGVNVGFDTIGKLSYLPDETRLAWITELIKMGYEKQLMLSLDITRKSHLKKNGGIGYGFLIDEFKPKLEKAGVSAEQIHQIFYVNPLTWLGVEHL